MNGRMAVGLAIGITVWAAIGALIGGVILDAEKHASSTVPVAAAVPSAGEPLKLKYLETSSSGSRYGEYRLQPPAPTWEATPYATRLEYRVHGKRLLYVTAGGAIVVPSETTIRDLAAYIVEMPQGCLDGR